jgi:hypothetical protein
MSSARIRIYVDHFLESPLDKARHLPLIAFSKEDVEHIHRILKDRGIGVRDVSKQKEVRIRCKHYPYTCKEVPWEHCDDFDCSCVAAVRKACRYDDLSRSYVPFSWDSPQMKHHDNCYEDCCCISTVFKRYCIFLNCCQGEDVAGQCLMCSG